MKLVSVWIWMFLMVCELMGQPVPTNGPVYRWFTNSAGITINHVDEASPYPSEIEVGEAEALNQCVTNVVVVLRGLRQSWMRDVDILLVGPDGETVLLLSDAGGIESSNTITFSGVATNDVPYGSLPEGEYRPTNYSEDSDAFLSPAPSGPYGTNMPVFEGWPGGTWSLYVMDDGAADSGAILSWELGLAVTACPRTNSFGRPEVMERYGYHVQFTPWTNAGAPYSNSWWSVSNYQSFCHAVPTNAVCPNTNVFAKEVTIFTKGNDYIIIWWAPNCTNRQVEFTYNSDIGVSTNWLSMAFVAPTNFQKIPFAVDPWWPMILKGTGATNAQHMFFRLRRMDFGRGCEAICQ